MVAVHPDLVPILRLSADDWWQMAAQHSLQSFTRRLFPAFETSDHILTLIDELERAMRTPDARLIVTMPPRHSKSLNVSEHVPAFYLGRNPEHRVIGASHSAHLAYTFSRRVRNKLTSPRWPFPKVQLADDKGAVQGWDIKNHRGGYIAVGVGGSPVGEGGNLIVIDDPLRSQADAESETVRESIWEWYQGTLRTRLEPGGSIILTATRWHEDDLTGRLLEEQAKGGETWRHLHMPAISDDGHALWPERWPLEALQRIRQAVGSKVFEAQYQGRPVPTEGGTFKRGWWQTYTERPLLDRVEVIVDSAFKTGTANDYSVFAAWGSDEYNNAYLLNVWRQRVEFPDLIRLGKAAMAWAEQRYAPIVPILVVEDQASGQSAIQVWHEENLTVTSYSPGSASKLARAEAITPFVEGGRAYVPEDAEWLDDWLVEHDRFPAGKHDDQVDTTVMALSRIAQHQSWNAEYANEFVDFVVGAGAG